jgi:hypothetical protein
MTAKYSNGAMQRRSEPDHAGRRLVVWPCSGVLTESCRDHFEHHQVICIIDH